VLHQVSSLTVVLNSLRLLVDFRRWRLLLGSILRTVRRRWRRAAFAGGLIVAAAYALSGFYVVSLGEVAVVQHFGRLVGDAAGPGLHYRLPYPFGRHCIVKPEEIRRVEVGFRTVAEVAGELPAYEWNVQHRGGRTQRQDEEAVVLTGDENLVDVNLIVQYRLADPVAAVFSMAETPSGGTDNTDKWDVLVRGVAEAELRAAVSQRTLQAVLGDRRDGIEDTIRHRIDDALQRYRTGIFVHRVCLADVHPPVEVVSSFREVAGAHEGKLADVNEATAYRLQLEALAEGQIEKRVLDAEAWEEDRVERTRGTVGRVIAVGKARAAAPEVARLRLYFDTLEETLAGRRKIIVDSAGSGGARRRVWLGAERLQRLLPASDGQGTLEELEMQGTRQP